MKAAVRPGWAVPGSRLLVEPVDLLPSHPNGPPRVRIGDHDAPVVGVSPRALRIVVPVSATGGTLPITIDDIAEPVAFVQVATTLATGVHQVDNPVFDGFGRLYVTQTGSRGNKVPVPLYRLSRAGVREPVPVEIANPTSMALGPDGAMYISSRFEGSVFRLTEDDQVEMYASELGVPTGLAFADDGTLYVGDRSGSIFRVSRGKQVETFATLPPSVAAFHMAFGPDGCLYVSAPTVSSRDPIYRITPERLVDVVYDGFGRPQGLAFDSSGVLYVVDALAGAAGLYRLRLGDSTPEPELLVTAPILIGLAFDPQGGLVLASNDTIWRMEADLVPLVIGRSA